MEPEFTTKKSFFDLHPEITQGEVLNFNAKGSKPTVGRVKWEERSLVYRFLITVKVDGRLFDWHVTRTYFELKELNAELTRQVADKLPPFPKLKAMQDFDPNEKLRHLELYLQGLTSLPRVNEHFAFWEFLEISQLSFEGVTKKRKEGYIYKRTGGRIANENKLCNCSKYFRRYQRRWFIVRDNLVGYLTDNMSESLNEALMFKGKFFVEYGSEATGWEDGIKLATSTREFIFRTGSVEKRMEWVEAITSAYQDSEWRNPDNPNDSSFPVREDNEATWYVDGEGYFAAVYEGLLKARRQVLISDWWLSPELYLKRPASEHPDSMLKKVLKRLASNGVDVYVHIYKEVELALTLNSLHSKDSLEAEHRNIKVVRHPHRSLVGGEFLWSHHDKLVVIDNELAFLGGLDLCFGRMDTNKHLLVDNGPDPFWTGIDYSNCRVADFTDVANWKRDSIDRHTIPRLPWHDIAMSVRGKAASDVALHFIELWNHVMTDITGSYYRNKAALEPIAARNSEDIKRSFTKIERRSEELQTEDLLLLAKQGLLEETKEPMRRSVEDWPRKESTGSFTEKKKQISTSALEFDLDRVVVQDHAVPIQSVNINPAVRRLMTENASVASIFAGSKHIMRSTTRAGEEERDVQVQQHLRPQPRIAAAQIVARLIETNLSQREAMEEAKEKQKLTEEIKRGEEHFAKNLIMPVLKKQRSSPMGSCRCQVLRSASTWSFGLDTIERSIHEAYIDLISKAEHFIYIENQFFISSTAEDPVKNKVAEALVMRIKAAAEQGQHFKVIVVMPLLPAFEGSVGDPNAAVLRVQLHWEYRTISRGFKSLYAQLKEDPNIQDPMEYIAFYGLRTHAVLGGTPVTEIVYVHSKLMIVDDNFVIIGSANINDRSMLGNNDSEIAVRRSQMLIEDTARVQTTFHGESFSASKFAHTLRMEIFSEHSGSTDLSAIIDPFSTEFEAAWRVTAKVLGTQNNTMVYRHVFGCYPDDEIASIQEISDYQQRAMIADYPHLRETVKGFLVEFPLEFLRKDDLRLSILNKEFFIPEVSFI
jgi:phospholipase D1/2